MEDLKKKLSEGKLTRVELNAAQPHDKNTLEWKAWNDLRIAMNDRTANLTEVHGMRLTSLEKVLIKHITTTKEEFAGIKLENKKISDSRKAIDEKMEKLIENDDRIVAMIEKYFTNHLHEVTDLWRAIDSKLESLSNEYRSNT